MLHDVRAQIWNELAERDWTPNDLASAMAEEPTVEAFGRQRLSLDILFTVDDAKLHLGAEGAAALARAFGTSPEFWLNLEAQGPEPDLEAIEDGQHQALAEAGM